MTRPRPSTRCTSSDRRSAVREAFKQKWVEEYARALFEKPPGVTRRAVAESLVQQAKRIEATPDFRVSVRSLEAWRRGAHRIDFPGLAGAAIGRRIRALRRQLGWTRRDLSGVSGVPVQSLTAYERGDRVPCTANLVRLSIALYEPMQRLLFGKRCLLPRILRSTADSAEVAKTVNYRRSLASADEWLSVMEAAALSGQPRRTWLWRAAQEIVQSEQQQRVSRARRICRPGVGPVRWIVHRSFVESWVNGDELRRRRRARSRRRSRRCALHTDRVARLVRPLLKVAGPPPPVFFKE